MYSEGRKGCYKCGKFGHMAQNCRSVEKLCYNCRQPGHETASCASPRSATNKQCYCCGGVGHIQSDCPTLKKAEMVSGNTDKKCHQCGRPGHIARFCPSTLTGKSAARPIPNASPIECYRCGGLNHFSRDCLAPAGTSVEGQQFVKSGKKEPATKEVATKEKTCYKCHQPGHIARECTQAVEGQV